MHIARPGTEESTLDHGDRLRGAQKRGESGAAGKVGCGEGGVAGSGEDPRGLLSTEVNSQLA
jgi:hypothetical protein